MGTKGEGFAFFRWHSIRWPHNQNLSGACCTQERDYDDRWRFICARLWAENDRA